MPWIVGIDEAGYGPNLGPFVMTSVACLVRQGHRKADLWDVLGRATRRPEEPTCTRLVVGDSKLVYTSGKGLAELERTVHAVLPTPVLTVSQIVQLLAPENHNSLQGEIWYTGATRLPVDADANACLQGAATLNGLCSELKIQWGPLRSVIVCPGAFNAMVERWGSKAAVLTWSMVQLLRCLPPGPHAVHVSVDKHGGRNNYAAALQPAFPECLVLAREEGSQRSVYNATDRGRRVQIVFEPRADANYFCVALASMISKYLREILMLEFNSFWQAKVPDLKPTAGYHLDAGRFWELIQPVSQTMGIAESALWRCR
jgi:hypothetical protein